MVDLFPSIRNFLLSDTDLTQHLSTFNGVKAIFTRRPIPETAKYPFIIINSPNREINSDFLDTAFREVTYNIIVYGNNDTHENYRKVEETAFKIKNKFLRVPKYGMTMPAGYSFVFGNSLGPFSAPVDDETKVGKAVSVTLSYNKLEN